MKLRVVHRTTYRYRDPATTSHHEARLTPRQRENQRTLSFDLEITPNPTTRRSHMDYFGNRTTYFGLEEPHHRLDVTATSLVEMGPGEPPEFSRTPPWETIVAVVGSGRGSDTLQAAQMRLDSPLVTRKEEFARYGAPSFPVRRPVLEGVRDLMSRVYRDFTYDPTATTPSTPLFEILHQKRGVCQDFSHVMLACLRSLGLAGRYVSGYLRTRPPEGQPRLVGADASHAWVSVWVPEVGWVDFDPTNDLCPGAEHVTVAFGRDFSDVTPVRGVILGGASHDLEVSVDVESVTDFAP